MYLLDNRRGTRIEQSKEEIKERNDVSWKVYQLRRGRLRRCAHPDIGVKLNLKYIGVVATKRRTRYSSNVNATKATTSAYLLLYARRSKMDDQTGPLSNRLFQWVLAQQRSSISRKLLPFAAVKTVTMHRLPSVQRTRERGGGLLFLFIYFFTFLVSDLLEGVDTFNHCLSSAALISSVTVTVFHNVKEGASRSLRKTSFFGSDILLPHRFQKDRKLDLSFLKMKFEKF